MYIIYKMLLRPTAALLQQYPWLKAQAAHRLLAVMAQNCAACRACHEIGTHPSAACATPIR